LAATCSSAGFGRQVNSSKFEGGEETITPIGMRTTYGTQQMSEEPTSQPTPAPPYRDLGTLVVKQKKCHPHAAMSASYSELARDPASGRFVSESRRLQHDAGEGSAVGCNSCALSNEGLRGCEPDSAATASNKCSLVQYSNHCHLHGHAGVCPLSTEPDAGFCRSLRACAT
jgi:hypothetical protein